MIHVLVELPTLPSPSDDEVLQACGDCLADLAALRDRGLVISAIVRRARALLRADMAYMSTNDLAAGETYIHHTDGVQTTEYASIRMPLGAGVLGAVAAGGGLVQTHGYLRDERLNHLADIDEIVRAEGVETIIGWPMRVGGRVVGALMAAHRSPVIFGAEAVRALELMAQHAAIAVEQTRLWGEVVRLDTQTETRELTELLATDDRLLAALLAEDGLSAIAAVLQEATGAEAAICDPAGRPLAGAALPSGLDLGRGEAPAVISSSVHGASATRHLFGDVEVALAAVTARGQHLGTVLLFGRAMREADLRILGRAAVHVSALLLFERNLAEAGLREQGVLFDDLLAGRPDAGLSSRLAEFGLTRASDCHLAVYRVPAQSRYQALGLIRQAHPSRALLTQHGGEICVLGVGDPGRTHADLARAGIPARVGVMDVRTDWSGVRRAHERAHQIAAALESLGRTSSVARLDDLGLAGLLVAGVDDGLVSSLVERQIGALRRYDADRGTGLCETALAYLETSSLAECAARLRVHVNTVRQRLERVDALLGVWRDGSKRADVHFALLLSRLRAPRS